MTLEEMLRIRAEVQARVQLSSTFNDPEQRPAANSTPIDFCASCGHARAGHRFRHIFRLAEPDRTLPEPDLDVGRFEVSCVPRDHPERAAFTINVEYRGHGLWAVTHLGRCYAADGSRSPESLPSERRDEWLAAHRFPFDEALALAKQIAPHLRVGRWGVTEALAEENDT